MKKLLSILGVTGVVVGTGSFAIAYSINKSSNVKEQVKPEGLTYKTSPQELDLNKDFNLDLYIKEKSEHNPERILKYFLNDKFNEKVLKKFSLVESDFQVINHQSDSSQWSIQLKSKKYNGNSILKIVDDSKFKEYKKKLNTIFQFQRNAFGTFHTQQDVLDQISVYAKDDNILGLKTLKVFDESNANKRLVKSNSPGINTLVLKYFDQEIKFGLNKVLENAFETQYFGTKISQIGYKLSGKSIVLDIAKYKNITEVPKHLPLKVNSLEKAFHKVESRYITNLDKWNTSNITSLLSAFDSAKDFNQDISTWDTSNVTNMQSTFFEAKNFNKPLDRWKVHNVTSMDNMFSGAESFNQSLNSWKTSNVQDMNKMFWSAKKFDGDITKWDVKKVKTMSFMFAEAESFNKNISLWNVENVETMYGMFSGAKKFKHNLKKWNAKSVTNIQDFRGRRESGNYVDWFREDNIPTFNQEILKTFK
ncbi:BspA family leucine-rich repeat surface protein [Mycoplasma putrefaciens]|uniref:BspA family leucine-rich repeat surface protein n=1 Tax=Mycoplasma putrefaciens TaxID=2123 RepID=UPI003DA31649